MGLHSMLSCYPPGIPQEFSFIIKQLRACSELSLTVRSERKCNIAEL